MQLYYGKYNHDKKKNNLTKLNNLSSGEPRIKIYNQSEKNNVKKKLYPNFGTMTNTEYIDKDKLFTMSSYKTKNN